MVIFQRPNKSLTVAFASWLAMQISSNNLVQNAGLLALVISGTIWSLQEIFRGDSPVRRVFGVLGMLYILQLLGRRLLQ